MSENHKMLLFLFCLGTFWSIFPWAEFYDRYVNDYEDITFIYNQDINLITDPKGFLYTIGTKQNEFKTSVIYKTPIDLLNNALFNGKKLKQIWDDLE